MGVIRRADAPKAIRPKETVDVPELGGEVIVQMPTLSDQLAIMEFEKYKQPAETLARSVIDADGERLYSAEEWEIKAVQHPGAANQLLEVAKALSLQASEKKPDAPS